MFSLGTFGMASHQSEPHWPSLGSTTATSYLVAATTTAAPESSRDAGEIAACWEMLLISANYVKYTVYIFVTCISCISIFCRN